MSGVKIGGPASPSGGRLVNVPGTIPSNAALGYGAVCFAISSHRSTETNDTAFKVT